MKDKKPISKTITVSMACGRKRNVPPKITFEGHYLADLGFSTGTKIKISAYKQMIIIVPDDPA